MPLRIFLGALISTLPLGCGGNVDVTRSTAGAGGASSTNSISGSGGEDVASSRVATGGACYILCPAAYLGLVLDVTTATSAAIVSDVEATFSGPTTGTMSCVPYQTVTACTWPSGPVTEGEYSILVTAPGFRSLSVNATVTTTTGSACGCPWASLVPSTVSLDSSAGGAASTGGAAGTGSDTGAQGGAPAGGLPASGGSGTCIAKTCEDYRRDIVDAGQQIICGPCGPLSDGCGGVIDCGSCCCPVTCEQACAAQPGHSASCSPVADSAIYNLECVKPDGCGNVITCYCIGG